MTGLEIIRAPGTTAEQIADIIAEHCPPFTPDSCDKLSCRECWLAWLATGEAASSQSADVLLPKGKGAPETQVPPDWELHFVTVRGVKIGRKQYNSSSLIGYVGKRVLVKLTPETVTAKTEEGDCIGQLTPFWE